MREWKNYSIVSVRKNYSGVIEQVEAFEYSNGNLIDKKTYSKQEIVKLIKNGFTFNTATRTMSYNPWTLGSDVRLVKGENSDYLRTDSNDIKRDNLGELPEF